tara:strand:- start:401 stop:1714 length:1314 start_codon:yes stop_codon:yes gene_type:complete
MELYNGDCLEILKDLSDNSVDFICSDLPYGRFHHLGKGQKDGKGWDIPINLEKMWEQLWRVAKKNCPIFLFGDFKFAMQIYNSQPKHFKYEIVWHKGSTTTPLLSRKRFGKCTEYILAFYKKQPVYNYAKYHKIIKGKQAMTRKGVVNWKGVNNYTTKNNYDPRLPLNVIQNEIKFSPMVIGSDNKMYHSKSRKYEPKLPLNVIENETIDTYNHLNHRGNKLSGKYNSYEPKLPLNVIEKKPKEYDGIKNTKNGEKYLRGKTWSPKLPLNVIDCSNQIVTNYNKNHKTKEKITMGDAWNGTVFKSFNNKYDPKLPLNVIENKIISNDTTIRSDWCGGKIKTCRDVYDPRLPLNVIKCQTKRTNKIIKKLTEKPQFVLEHLLKYFSNEGDVCLDITMGSGSLGVACNTLGRKFIGIEKNKEFFNITKERLSNLKVKTP